MERRKNTARKGGSKVLNEDIGIAKNSKAPDRANAIQTGNPHKKQGSQKFTHRGHDRTRALAEPQEESEPLTLEEMLDRSNVYRHVKNKALRTVRRGYQVHVKRLHEDCPHIFVRPYRELIRKLCDLLAEHDEDILKDRYDAEGNMTPAYKNLIAGRKTIISLYRQLGVTGSRRTTIIQHGIGQQQIVIQEEKPPPAKADREVTALDREIEDALKEDSNE